MARERAMILRVYDANGIECGDADDAHPHKKSRRKSRRPSRKRVGDTSQWRADHVWVGRRAKRVLDGVPYEGVIASWLRGSSPEHSLWQLVHDDGPVRNRVLVFTARTLKLHRPAWVALSLR